MSDARDEILARVRDAKAGAVAPATLPRAYRQTDVRAPDELVTLFCERVGDYRAEVRRIAAGELAEAIAACAQHHSARRLVIPAQLPDEWLPVELQLVADTTTLSPHELDSFDGVITGCTAAIAETGTIALTGGPHEGRRILSLVPDLHICIVHTDQIVGGVPEAIAALGPTVADHNRPVTLVSGPSATSDIELQRVEGVHGPRKLVVLVIEESA